MNRKKKKLPVLLAVLLLTALYWSGTATANPTLPANFVRLHDTDPLNLLDFDTFTLYNYDPDAQDFLATDFDLANETWKENAIMYLANSTLDEDLDCPLWNGTDATMYDCAHSYRNQAWDKAYPYMAEVWEEATTVLLKLLIHYFDPWENAANLTIVLHVVSTVDGLKNRVWDVNGTHPLFLGYWLMKALNAFVRKVAYAVEEYDLGNQQRVNIMQRTMDIYGGTLTKFYTQPHNGTWYEPGKPYLTGYVGDTFRTLNGSIDDLEDHRTVFDFDFWVDEVDVLTVDLELIRDGFVDWGLTYHLSDDLGHFLSGDLTGTVTEQGKEKGLSGVNVLAVNTQTGYKGQTATENGRYTISDLPRGEYEVTFTYKTDDFAPHRMTSHIQPFQTTEADVGMVRADDRGEAAMDYTAYGVAAIIGLAAVLLIASRLGFSVKNWKAGKAAEKAPKTGGDTHQ